MDKIKLPGLVDIHVHFRDPGQTHKEDFLAGTSAALAGGFTDVFDMPNNAEPITSAKALEAKIASARRQIVCNVGLYFGSLGDNLDEFDAVKDRVCGLKLYLNVTTGNYLLSTESLTKIFTAWNSPKPILLHAESDVIKTALEATAATGQATHVCHVSNRTELEPIIEAKRAGVPVTCGVTPHHLFLTNADEAKLGNLGKVKPDLKPKADQDYLWSNLDQIDVVESDHAPHTLTEKAEGVFGLPGLETTLPLLLQAEREGKLTRADIIEKCADAPRRILGLTADTDTFIDVDLVEYKISAVGLKSKSAWTPYAGRTAFGRVATVTIRGQKVFENGQVLAKPGDGRLI